MSQYQGIFQRYEKKYLLSRTQYQNLSRKLESHMREDQYGKSTICNIYYDTPDHRLIRESMEKPIYKEKLRLRSYGVPKKEDIVFVELKKKYKGVVYKRRVNMPLCGSGEMAGKKRMPPSESDRQRDRPRIRLLPGAGSGHGSLL